MSTFYSSAAIQPYTANLLYHPCCGIVPGIPPTQRASPDIVLLAHFIATQQKYHNIGIGSDELNTYQEPTPKSVKSCACLLSLSPQIRQLDAPNAHNCLITSHWECRERAGSATLPPKAAKWFACRWDEEKPTDPDLTITAKCSSLLFYPPPPPTLS